MQGGSQAIRAESKLVWSRERERRFDLLASDTSQLAKWRLNGKMVRRGASSTEHKQLILSACPDYDDALRDIANTNIVSCVVPPRKGVETEEQHLTYQNKRAGYPGLSFKPSSSIA